MPNLFFCCLLEMSQLLFKSYSQFSPPSLLILCSQVIAIAKWFLAWAEPFLVTSVRTNTSWSSVSRCQGRLAHQEPTPLFLPFGHRSVSFSCLYVSSLIMTFYFLVWEIKNTQGRCPVEETLEFGRIYQSMPKSGLGVSHTGIFSSFAIHDTEFSRRQSWE